MSSPQNTWTSLSFTLRLYIISGFRPIQLSSLAPSHKQNGDNNCPLLERFPRGYHLIKARKWTFYRQLNNGNWKLTRLCNKGVLSSSSAKAQLAKGANHNSWSLIFIFAKLPHRNFEYYLSDNMAFDFIEIGKWKCSKTEKQMFLCQGHENGAVCSIIPA
jgi:hypothetical protein